jgi:glycosyltransferase involved in cell wall biosynthesis
MNTGSEDRFAVFILTHGRPNKVITYNTLRKQGYTGDVYIIVDNEDKTLDQYRQRFGDKVIVFDKAAVAQTFDEGDNFNDRRAVIYARNASFQIARDLGLDYFLQLDDDYTRFTFKFTPALVYAELYIENLDRLFATVLDYYKSIPALTVALAQNGDFLGGAEGGDASRVWMKRKAMNTFFCSTARPFQFFGRINEDVNTYVTLGNRGGLFLSLINCAIQQGQSQASAGGMTEMYLDAGTYVKTFYTVMYAPSCVKVYQMASRHPRIHHNVKWDCAVPRILSEDYRKAHD